MRFEWPIALALLALIPVLVGLHVWWRRRKRRYAVVFSDLSLVRQAAGSLSWRRHLPFAVMLAAVASLAIASARPHIVTRIPLNQTSIILAIDVSRSMCATDIAPNRLGVAQEAARTFIRDQAGGAKIGVVIFAGTAQVAVPPTEDTEQLIDAIGRFRTSFGTALGTAQLKAIDAIAEVNPDVAPAGDDIVALDTEDGDRYQPDIIVLLTDGANSTGPEPIGAAEQAAERRVRVYTIGFGTDQPVDLICDTTQIGVDRFDNGAFGQDGVGGDSFGGVTGSFGGGGGRGGGLGDAPSQLLVIDEPTLQGIAATTGGSYFRAEDAEQLIDVFVDLPSQIAAQKQEREISSWFTALAAALVIVALAISLRWNRA